METKLLFSQRARLFLLVLVFSGILGCSNHSTHKAGTTQPKSSTKPDDIELIRQKEIQSQTKSTDQFGILISKADFRLLASREESKDFKDGVVPWISIDNPDKEIDRLIDKDQIIIPYQNVTLVIDYPLNNPTSTDIVTSGTGFSRRNLISQISRVYREIYAEEEKTATTKTIPMEKRKGMINRNTTDGTFGIWGHDLTDLVLSSVEVYRSPGGRILLNLIVES